LHRQMLISLHSGSHRSSGCFTATAFFQWREGCRHVPVYAVILDTRPDVIQAERSSGEAFKVDRQRMANEAQLHPEKVQVFRQHVQEALACEHHPVAPEKLDGILLQASATVFAGKPEAQPPNAWQQPETALRLQDVWEHRAEHLRLAKQVRVAFLCIRYRAARSMWNFWLSWYNNNAEQALARHDTHAFFAVIQQLAPKQERGRVQLKGEDGGMLTAEAEIDALHTYWDGIFNDGAQAHDTLLTEGVFVAAPEVLEVVARLPMRKAAMPGRAPCAAWKLAAEDVAPHLHAYVQQAWAPGPVHVPLYLTEAWLHFMSKPGRTLRTPGDLRPLALQTGGGKALSRLLKNQLTPFAERAALHVPQFAYLRNRDTHSAIARALTHIDKVRSITHGGQRLSIHARKAGVQQQRCAGGATLSLDLSRAFDSVGHDVLWEALSWAAVPQDLATLLMTWYRSEYAFGQRGADGYTRRISITKGVKQGCVIAPTIWVILTCFVHHRLDERLSPAWSERHATCFADDFLFQWELESMQACKAMCTDVRVIYEVFASLGLCINSKKSAFLLKLVGPEAEAWLAKHRVLAPEGVEAKHVLRYDLFRRCDVPIKHTHVYLGIALTYDSYEEASMRHRLRLAATQKHRLSRILQGRGGLTVRCRLRLWRVAIATSMLYATHVVGLTRASLRSAHVMMTKHLRAIMRSPRHLTQENDLAFLQSISQDTPLQLVLKAIGSMLDRANTHTDFPCFAVEDVMHRLRALRCNMISFSEAPAPRGMRLTEVPASAPVFTCQICGQHFATLHQVKNHEGPTVVREDSAVAHSDRRVSLNWSVESQRALIMTGATTMAPPVAMDKQVMALFGHVLTPMAGEKALGSKQGGPPQEMEVDSSRKRPRQTRQSPPKGKGKGRGKPKDREEATYSDSSERDLVLALGRIVLQQADQLHRLELDTGFFLVLATAPAAGTVIPTMFEVAELWRKKQMETPEQITCSLGVMMMRCLLQELSNRLSHALKTPEVVAALTKQEMLTDKQVVRMGADWGCLIFALGWCAELRLPEFPGSWDWRMQIHLYGLASARKDAAAISLEVRPGTLCGWVCIGCTLMTLRAALDKPASEVMEDASLAMYLWLRRISGPRQFVLSLGVRHYQIQFPSDADTAAQIREQICQELVDANLDEILTFFRNMLDQPHVEDFFEAHYRHASYIVFAACTVFN
ncbi:RTase, partial [Symbiodinium sp. KB8]